MGKKKKKVSKPWCYYCDREFDDEKILIQHQKAKHFKCHVCHKKLSTASGMIVHVLQVHKETVSKVPNAKPGRDSTELEIFGMEGVPYEALEAHDGVEEPKQAKAPKVEIPTFQPASFNPVLPPSIGMSPQTLYAPTPPIFPQPPQPIQMPRPPHPGVVGPPGSHGGITSWPPQPPPPQHVVWPPRPPSVPPPRPLPPQPLFPIQPSLPSGPPPPPLFPISSGQAPPPRPPQPLFPIANSQTSITPSPPSGPAPPSSQPPTPPDVVGVRTSSTPTNQSPYSSASASGHMYASGPSTGGPSIGPPPAIANKPPSQAPSAPEVYLVWDDEMLSMEERRLNLPRYRASIEAPSAGSMEATRLVQGGLFADALYAARD